MIPISNAVLYDKSLEVLQSVVGHNYLGRLAQIFLAAKHYGKGVPQIGDQIGLQSRKLEELLDDLYAKPSRGGPEKILILFAADHKVPSGQLGGGLTHPSNIWRNNLNLQKGFICYGGETEMLSPAFRNPTRLSCPHLVPATGNPGSLAKASCALSAGAKYRGEDHPRVLRKDDASGEHWIYDPSDHAFYASIFLPENGSKIPIAALIIALYHDSKLAAGRTGVDISDFLSDFDFSAKEFALYFDADPGSPAHQELLVLDPSINWSYAGPPAPASAAAPLPGLPPIPAPAVPTVTSPSPSTSAPVLGATTSGPPAGGHWWNAEQAVRSVLESDGWQVLDFTRLGAGYDFKVTKAGTVRLVEVKSAVGKCAPTLTKREYDEAKHFRSRYVLAIVENYDPTQAVNIQWVQDPAALQVTIRSITGYYLPRSVWQGPASGTFP